MTELAEPLHELAIPPTTFTRHLSFPDPSAIRIYDDTLRDGEQMPGVAFSPEQKLEIALLLSRIGVHVMDVAFPVISLSDRQALQLIVKAQKKGEIREDVEILAMCRANPADIDAVVETLHEIGASPNDVSILVLSTLSDIHLKYKLGRTLLKREGRDLDQWIKTPVEFYREANVRMTTEAIRYAREKGIDRIEFAAEDSSRSHLDYAAIWARACIEAGGTRMCFSDTCGIFTPEGVDFYIPAIVKILGGIPLTAHFHNDFGLGPINTVRALSHGALYAGVTANGIGERAGNTPLHEVVMILKDLYGVTIPHFQYASLTELRRLVEKYSGIPLQPHEPIVGEGVFSHESGIHAAGVSIHPAIYQVIPESSVGGKRRFVFGKHSGAAAVEAVLAQYEHTLHEHHIEVTPTLIKNVLEQVKKIREDQITTGVHEEAVSSHYQYYHSLGIPEQALVHLVLEMTGRRDLA